VKYIITDVVIVPNPSGPGYQVDFDFNDNQIHAIQLGIWNQYTGAVNSYTFPSGFGGSFDIGSNEFPNVPAMTISLVGQSTNSSGHCTFIAN
jgi:hypothetical protein